MCCINESALRAPEEIIDEFLVLKAADVDGDIFQLGELLCDYAAEVSHLGAHLPSQCGSHPNEARRLSSIAVDSNDGSLHSAE